MSRQEDANSCELTFALRSRRHAPTIAILVQAAGSSHSHCRKRSSELPAVSCTRINNLLVRLIRGKPWKRLPQMGQDFPRGVLGVLAATLLGVTFAAAQQVANSGQDADGASASSADQDPKSTGNDLTRPENALDLRYQYRKSSGTTTQTDRDIWILRGTSRLQLDPDWKLSLLAQTDLVDKTTFTQGEPEALEFGLGNSVFQAVLIRNLSEREAFGFGARLVAPTASDGIGSGNWQIMPGFGFRYTFMELSKDTYFVPAMRYAVSFGGNPATRNISEPQFAPTFNLDLPGPWYLTFYPSYDIRINYGDPVSGQTGRLFLPADLAVGYALTDKVAMSLEVSAPIIKDYPVYDFKTEFRVVIKN